MTDEERSDAEERACVERMPVDERPHYELNDGTCVTCGEPWACWAWQTGRAMTEDYYPSVEAYTADIVAARDAYAADMAVQRGDCETCQRRRKDGQHRKCWTCRHGAAS